MLFIKFPCVVITWVTFSSLPSTDCNSLLATIVFESNVSFYRIYAIVLWVGNCTLSLLVSNCQPKHIFFLLLLLPPSFNTQLLCQIFLLFAFSFVVVVVVVELSATVYMVVNGAFVIHSKLSSISAAKVVTSSTYTSDFPLYSAWTEILNSLGLWKRIPSGNGFSDGTLCATVE